MHWMHRVRERKTAGFCPCGHEIVKSFRYKGLGVWFFLFFDAVREDAKCESLRGGYGFLFGGAVGKYAGKIRNLGDPTSVGLDFRFHFVNDVAHVLMLARPLSGQKT